MESELPASKKPQNGRINSYLSKSINYPRKKQLKKCMYFGNLDEEEDESDLQESQKDLDFLKELQYEMKSAYQRIDNELFSISKIQKIDQDLNQDYLQAQQRLVNPYENNRNQNNLINNAQKKSLIDPKKIYQDKLSQFYNKSNQGEKIFFQLLEQGDKYTNMLEKIVSDSGMGDADTCLMCLQLPLVPLKCQNCKMMVCAKCAFEWIEKKDECPYGCVGQWNLQKPSNTELNGIVLQQHFYCEYFKFGCQITNKIQEVIQHEQNCKHKAIPCQFCKNLVVQHDMSNHEQICEYRECICNKCTFTYIARDKKVHNCIKTVLAHYQKLQQEFKQYKLDTEEKLENIDKQVNELVDRKSRQRYYPYQQDYSKSSSKLIGSSLGNGLSSTSQAQSSQVPLTAPPLSKSLLIKQSNPFSIQPPILSNEPNPLIKTSQLQPAQKLSTMLNLQKEDNSNSKILGQSSFTNPQKLPEPQISKFAFPYSLQSRYVSPPPPTVPLSFQPSNEYQSYYPFSNPFTFPSFQSTKPSENQNKQQPIGQNKKQNESINTQTDQLADKNSGDINKSSMSAKPNNFSLDNQVFDPFIEPNSNFLYDFQENSDFYY